MRFACAILAAAIGAAAISAGQAAGAELPVTFARSGSEVVVPVHDVPPMAKVVLTAFGRKWSGPLEVDRRPAGATAKFKAPEVRVPTVFALASAADTKRVLAELVVYPARPVEWDKHVVLHAVGAPQWFDQWSQATGLPVEKVKNAAQAGRQQQAPRAEDRRLLILGRDQAGRTAADLIKLTRRCQMNLLVLDAGWFGRREAPKEPAGVRPEQMAGELADLQRQRWPLPPSFRSHRLPWPGLCNRWFWIGGDDGPLLEDIGGAAFGRRVVLSYLPWQQQLGRCEMADELLRTVLRAAARPWPESRRSARPVEIVDPPMTEEAKKARPVLTAAVTPPERSGVTFHSPAKPVLVLDLRGEQPPGDGIAKKLAYLQSTAGVESPLLILGDDPLLDRWQWLRLRRHKKRKIGVPFATWLPHDVLPPPVAAQVQLMGKLSELGVLLWSKDLEKEDEGQTR